MKRWKIFSGTIVFATVIWFLTSCENPTNSDEKFVAVSSITNVPTSGTVGSLTLFGIVDPPDATNKSIVWSVESIGTTGASINGNTLTTTKAGSVTVVATIANGLAQGEKYTQSFSIEIMSDITYIAVQTGGADGVSDTTAITLTFNSIITGLTALDITVTDVTGSVTKGSLAGSETSWLLGITVKTAGNITVSINKPGIEAGTKSVTVYKAGQNAPGTPGLAFELINNGTTYRVRKGTITDDAVVIPATYNNLPVTEIGSESDSSSDGAFRSTKFTSITIPNSVTSIGKYAFGSSGLTSIFIPASVTSIGDYAFYGCNNLISIMVDVKNLIYASQDGILYNKIKTNLIQAPRGITGNVSIPARVTTIEKYAFSDCSAITSIIIPANVTTIGIGAFSGDPNISMALATVTFMAGSQLTTIGSSAFSNCTSLSEINLPSNITYISDIMFSGCSSLTSITIPTNVTRIGSQAFGSCINLTSIIIPTSVTSIGSNSFSYCLNLIGINVDANNSNYVSEGGILYNKEKTRLIKAPGAISGNITIPDSVINIDNGAFEYCSNLTGINISANATSINNSTFSFCTKLNEVNISENVTSIIRYAFSHCASLTSITIPASVMFIDAYAFEYCSGLTSVTFTTGSAISNDNFWSSAFPQGNSSDGGDNLRTAYLAGGAGTYTRDIDGDVWTKVN